MMYMQSWAKHALSKLYYGVKNNKTKIVFLVGLIIFSLLTFSTNIMQTGDDVYFYKNTQTNNLNEWVGERYDSWTGRVTAESYTYLIFHNFSINTWRLLNIINYVIVVLVFYKIYKLVKQGNSIQEDAYFMSISTLGVYTMGLSILSGSVFWVTGSLNYFWITSLGMASMYPLIYVYLKHINPPKYMMAGGLLLSFLACMGQEQVYFLSVVFSILIVLGLYIKTRKVWIYPSLQLAVSTVAAFISYRAPGNILRNQSEISSWLPSLPITSFLNRAEWSYRWFLDAVVNHLGILMIVIWLSIGLIILYNNKKKKFVLYLVGWFLIIGALARLLLQGNTNALNFYPQWGMSSFYFASYIYLFIWSALIVATLYGAYIVSNIYDSKRKYMLTSILSGMLISVGLMTLSPTMYASGQRTLFVPGILGVMAVIVICSYMYRIKKPINNQILSLTIAIAISQLLILVISSTNIFQNLGF